MRHEEEERESPATAAYDVLNLRHQPPPANTTAPKRRPQPLPLYPTTSAAICCLQPNLYIFNHHQHQRCIRSQQSLQPPLPHPSVSLNFCFRPPPPVIIVIVIVLDLTNKGSSFVDIAGKGNFGEGDNPLS
jgi:hypothetical protein